MTELLYESGFLKEDNGRLSLIRLLSFMTWFPFTFMVVYQTIKNTYDIWAILIVGCLVFVPKVFQKIVEAKAGINK